MEWCVKDICGYVCVFFTYFTLLVVDMGVVFFSLPQRLLQSQPLALFHLIFFNCIIAIISVSHVKCMTSNPGTIQINQQALKFEKLPDSTKELVEDAQAELVAAEAGRGKGRKSQGLDLTENILTLGQLENICEKRNKVGNQKARSLNSISRQGKGRKFNTNFDDRDYSDDQNSQGSESEEEDSVIFTGNLSRTDQLLKVMARKCKKCNSFKPPKSHHCSTCGRCIARMDHHCPWVNNCVGYYNQKHFLLFMFYVVVGCLYAGVLFFFKIRDCNKFNQFCGILKDLKMLILALLNVFLMLLFVLFCIVMTFDQLNCIITEQSTIDKLSKEKTKRKRTAMQSLERVFGGKFGLHWFLPTSIPNALVLEQEY